MAFDKLYIVNRMLIACGEKTISSLGKDAKSQRLANEIFDGIVEEVFALDIDFRFATTRAELTQHSATPISGYDFMYKIPNGCIRILSKINEKGDEIQYKYRREVYLYTEGGVAKEDDVILTDRDTCFIKFIVLRTNAQRWKPWFRKLVILSGAVELCQPLSKDDFRALRVEKRLEKAIKDAERANNKEDVDVDYLNNNENFGNNDVVESEYGRGVVDYRGWDS